MFGRIAARALKASGQPRYAYAVCGTGAVLGFLAFMSRDGLKETHTAAAMSKSVPFVSFSRVLFHVLVACSPFACGP